MRNVVTRAMLVVGTACLVVAVSARAPQPPPTGGEERASRAQSRGGQGRGPLTPEQAAAQKARQAASAPDAPRPIDMLDTVWIEEQTWMETRDAIKAGKTTAIIGTGGLEQNGPYMPNGKHNFVLRTTCEATARRLGNALCAPIVTLEPGNPERQGLTPGSVFITQETFRAILSDMATSLKSMGFTDIVLIGDSGGNTNGMKETAAALNAKWSASAVGTDQPATADRQGRPARVHFVPEYYDEDRWSFNYLKTIGILQKPDVQSATRYDIHDDYHYEALVAVTDQKQLRAEQRKKAKRFSINGVEMESVEKVVANGRKLAEYRAKITADAIVKAIAASR